MAFLTLSFVLTWRFLLLKFIPLLFINGLIRVAKTWKQFSINKTLIKYRYGSSVAKPAANPGIEVRSKVRLEATIDPWVAQSSSQANNLQQHTSYKVLFLLCARVIKIHCQCQYLRQWTFCNFWAFMAGWRLDWFSDCQDLRPGTNN